MAERLLLDTCAIIWASLDEPLKEAAMQAIDLAWQEREPLRVSPISAWEIGLLVARGRIRSNRPPLQWFDDFVSMSEAELVPLSPPVLIASSFLPGEIHGDPADRIIVATARENDLTIVTRDREILRYGGEGHVKVLEC